MKADCASVAPVAFLRESHIEQATDLRRMIQLFDCFYSQNLVAIGTPRSELYLSNRELWCGSAIASLPEHALVVSKVGTELVIDGRTCGDSLLSVFDSCTGALRYAMSAEALTAARVGASTASLFRRHFPTLKPRVGVFGSGRLALWVIRAFEVVGYSSLSIVGRDSCRLKSLQGDLEREYEITVSTHQLGIDTIPPLDVAIFATSARAPFLTDSALADVQFCASVGAHGAEMGEIPLGMFKRAYSILVDSLEGAQATGDLKRALTDGVLDGDLIQLAELLEVHEKKKRQVLLWKSVGDIRYDAIAALALCSEFSSEGKR